ncbi:MAG: hypothetical protein AB7N71_00160 [Phycisphaerae bacterium]
MRLSILIFIMVLSACHGPAFAVQSGTSETIDDIANKAKDVAERLNTDPRAAEVSAGILKPIYQLAEYFSFTAFHWVAFAAMVAGVVSFGAQLALGKLVMLSRGKLSIMEILSDGLGLFISLVGLVLTTQAATENSTFPQYPANVISAAVVGGVVGFVFYLQGQSQELKAARRTRE